MIASALRLGPFLGVRSVPTRPDFLNVAQAYVDDIERLIAEDFLTDALEKLLDFVRDFAPALKNEALTLYARHSRIRKSVKHDNGDVGAFDRIVDDVLALAERTKEIALDTTDLAGPATLPAKVSEPPSGLQAGPARDHPRRARASPFTRLIRPPTAR